MKQNNKNCRAAGVFMILLMLLSLPNFVAARSNEFYADDEGDKLIEALVKNRRTLRLENGGLTGEGAKFLINEANSSQFFLIGEDHGMADMPVFTAALFQSIRTIGYQNFATETGPITALYLEKMARQASGEKAFADFNTQYPFGLPFYNWKEEAQMAIAIMADNRSKGTVFWGLDQEFIGSPAFHFKRLVELAPDKKAKLVADGYYEKTKTEFHQIIKDKKPEIAFLSSAKNEDFDKLDAAFVKAGAEAKTILSELRESREIYRKNSERLGYDSNLQRSILMKRHFISYYNKALKQRKILPKVLFKLGANHVKLGKNYTNVYDIGNFVSELAASNGSSSFHLFVQPLSGTKNNYVPFLANVADKNRKIEITENSGILDARSFLQVTEKADKKDWTVIDLRPLRPLVSSGKLKQLPRGLADLVWGFDAILLMPEVKAATLFE